VGNLYEGGKGTLLLDDAYQKLCEACGHDRELYSTLEAMGLPEELPESEQTADKIRFIIPQIKKLEEILAEATEALSTYVRNFSGHGGKKDDSSIEGSSSSRTERHPGTDSTVQEALATSEWYVSYAWGDDRTPEGRAREEIVDHLCTAAMAQGHVIFRDKNVLNLGDRISNFMKRIGRGDRIFVILSDKYLRSPYCMFELSEIWRTSQQEGEAFLNRVRIYALPDAKIFQPEDWVDWSIYWKKEHDNLESRAQQHGIVVLGEQGHRRLTQMRNLYSQISDILGTVADIVQPRTFEDLERYGFSERTDEVGDRTQLR
jgi:internalin A